MEKFLNNSAWRRIRGLRGLGVFALSVAFCLAGALAFSSCDILDDDDEAEPDIMEMRGFFTSVNTDDEPGCVYENPDVVLEGDDSTGKLNVTMKSTGPDFPGYTFIHRGVKLIEGEGDSQKKTIVTGYLSLKDDSYSFPGTYFLTSRTEEIGGEDVTIFAGFWAGHLVRPTGNPVVICPYVLVPRDALAADSCGTEDEAMAPVLSKYLATDTEDLRECNRVLDGDGLFLSE